MRGWNQVLSTGDQRAVNSQRSKGPSWLRVCAVHKLRHVVFLTIGVGREKICIGAGIGPKGIYGAT